MTLPLKTPSLSTLPESDGLTCAGAVGAPTAEPDAGKSETTASVPTAPAPTVIGLDLSMGRTGVATATGVDSLVAPSQVKGFARMRWIRARVLEWTNGADLVVVEAPAFSSNQAYAKEIAGLWHVVMIAVDARGTRWVDVMSNTLKKYGTGKGRCEKTEMVIAAVKRMPWLEVSNDDEADAAWACAFGHELLDAPIVELPQEHRSALVAVRSRFTEAR